MAETNAFAEAPPTPESFVARVREELGAAYASTDISAAQIDRAAVDAVDELWDRPIKTFIPVLALRAARERVAATTGTPPAADEPAITAAANHGLPDDRDALLLDSSDELVFADPDL